MRALLGTPMTVPVKGVLQGVYRLSRCCFPVKWTTDFEFAVCWGRRGNKDAGFRDVLAGER